MRLWSLHPCYLDTKGLVALWREGLLAQAVLKGKTKGYINHPQMNRFKKTDHPVQAIAAYLFYIADEAGLRNYHFNRQKITANGMDGKMTVTDGQLEYEFGHLLNKLALRDPDLYQKRLTLQNIKPHPLFEIIRGDIEDWEIVSEKKR